jgi:hypothetical protein
VPASRSSNPLSPVLEFDAHGNEILYRTMSPADFAKMQRTGQIPSASETFVSPLEAYSKGYEGVTVKITVKPGTMDELMSIGGTGNAGTATLFPELPRVSKGWTATSAQFKLEATNIPSINNGFGVVNTGLGRGEALRIFNSNILHYQALPK